MWVGADRNDRSVASGRILRHGTWSSFCRPEYACKLEAGKKPMERGTETLRKREVVDEVSGG